MYLRQNKLAPRYSTDTSEWVLKSKLQFGLLMELLAMANTSLPRLLSVTKEADKCPSYWPLDVLDDIIDILATFYTNALKVTTLFLTWRSWDG